MRKLRKAVRKVYSGRMGEKGFTLIELLVVIGILAALAGVVTLAVGQFLGRGACQACLTEKHNVQTAVVAYMADHEGSVPTSGDFSELVGTSGYLMDTPVHATDWTWDSNGLITVNCSSLITNCVTNETAASP
jgi:prepilin-type N-terminal cleavage/methylation domain-containing protein